MRHRARFQLAEAEDGAEKVVGEENDDRTRQHSCVPALCHCSRSRRRGCCLLTSLSLTALVSLLLAVLVRGFTLTPRYTRLPLPSGPPLLLPSPATRLAWAETLAAAIKIPTVSRGPGDQDEEEILRLHQHLRTSFPEVFSSDKVEVHYPGGGLSILLRVAGSVAGSRPVLLAAHLDVVPAGEEERWQLPAFLGQVVQEAGQDWVWGRGAIDDKHSLVGILTALAAILRTGPPARTLYVALGHDEEVGGKAGAGTIAPVLAGLLDQHGEQLEFILDEGMFVMSGVVPGVQDPVIYLGVVEKGWAMVELSATGEQRHSSTPPRQSAIGRLARAVSRLEQHRSPAQFGRGPEHDTMEYLAPFATTLLRLVLGNLWLFSQVRVVCWTVR